MSYLLWCGTDERKTIHNRAVFSTWGQAIDFSFLQKLTGLKEKFFWFKSFESSL